jgi:hypothetical protein
VSLFYTANFRLTCVDPGLRGCGVAEFIEGNLVRAAYVKNPREVGRGYEVHRTMARAVQQWMTPNVDRLVIELPRVYPGSAQQKGDLNDLLDLTGVGGAIASSSTCVVESIFPSDWKGQVPKEMMTERIKRALTPEEKATAEKCAASLAHNIWDAAGIGLHKLSRLNKKVLHD